MANGRRKNFFSLHIYHLPFSICHAPHAAIALPPGIFVPTGVAAGPACLRLLNQRAVNQTRAPGAVSGGKTTWTPVLPVCAWKVHSDSSLGGVPPTKEKTFTPSTPAGLPRRGGPAWCRRSAAAVAGVAT